MDIQSVTSEKFKYQLYKRQGELACGWYFGTKDGVRRRGCFDVMYRSEKLLNVY